MSIVKPYNFVGGTKARAQEVNDNFDRLYEQVNINITDIANAQTDITNLGIDKADVQGSSLQRFAVADATGDYDAINKQTLMGRIANSLDTISGLQITKDPSNPDDRIIVSKGACYDNEREIVLRLYNSLGKTNDNQIASAKYYVYIIGDDYGTTIDILISPDSITPGMPSGYTRYRKIGYFETDGNNKISNIYSFGIDPENPNSIKSSYVSGDNGYVVFSNGFKVQWGSVYHTSNDQSSNVYFLTPWSTPNYSCGSIWTANANVGDKKFNYSLTNRTTTYMTIRSQTESFQSQNRTIFWICTGF